VTTLLELAFGLGLVLAVLLAAASAAHDDGRVRVAVPVRRRR
jgi:hypothetical protein